MHIPTFLPLVAAAVAHAYTLPLNCAPNGTIMTTPSYGTTDAVFTVCAQDTINSSPSLVYNVLLDFPRYPAWNTFVYAVDLPSNVSSAADVYVGMTMTLHTDGLLAGVNTTSYEMITYLEPNSTPAFVAWALAGGVIGDAVLESEHVSLLNDLGNGSTEYVSWETYYMAGALLVES